MRLKLPLVAKALAAGAVIAAVLVPASAAGSTSARVKLAVVPLPKSSIGSVARPLQISYFSGVVSNAEAARRAMYADTTERTFKKLGRVSGYLLDYGVVASGGSGVTDVQTGIEQYKTSTAAKRGLAFWKSEDASLRLLNQGSFAVKNSTLKVPAVGKARFAYLTSYKAPDIVPLWTVDERIVEGKYVLQVQVSAGTATAAKALAPKLAKKLDARLKLALKGRLHGKPVKLPPPLRAGPPAGGPDLSALAAKTSDLSPAATLKHQGYLVNRGVISAYEVEMSPAAPFDSLTHDIEWAATANQAAFETDWYIAYWSDETALFGDKPSDTIDLSGIGHGAHGVIAHFGKEGDVAVFTINVGQLAQYVTVESKHSVQASPLQALAQTLATRLDAVYTG